MVAPKKGNPKGKPKGKPKGGRQTKDKGITTTLKARLMKIGAIKDHIIRKRRRARQSTHARKGATKGGKGSKRMTVTERGRIIHALVKAWVDRELLVAGQRFTRKSIESILNKSYPGITRAARAVATYVVENGLIPTHSELTVGANQIDLVVRNQINGHYQIIEIKTKSCDLAHFTSHVDKPVSGFTKKHMTSEADQVRWDEGNLDATLTTIQR